MLLVDRIKKQETIESSQLNVNKMSHVVVFDFLKPFELQKRLANCTLCTRIDVARVPLAEQAIKRAGLSESRNIGQHWTTILEMRDLSQSSSVLKSFVSLH